MKKIGLIFSFCAIACFGFSQVKVVAPNGHTGIGPAFTTGGQTPAHKLDVDGNAQVRGTNLYVGTNAGSAFAKVNVGLGRAAGGSAGFTFYNSTATGGTDFNLQLAVSGDDRSIFDHRGANALIFAVRNSQDILFRTNDIVRMTVQENGQVDVNGSMTVNGGVSVTSDKRLKNNINNFDKGLEELMRLNPVSFNYTGEARTDASRKYTGLIAQELQKVVPEFVSGHVISEYDSNDKITNENEYLKIHDSELKYLIINSVQEQQKLIEEKEEKISDLESRLELLESAFSALDITRVVLNDTDEEIFLGQNTPNPFGTKTSVSYKLPMDYTTAKMVVTNVNGQVLKQLSLEGKGAGIIEFDASSFTSNGLLNYSIVIDGKVKSTKKMILSK